MLALTGRWRYLDEFLRSDRTHWHGRALGSNRCVVGELAFVFITERLVRLPLGCALVRRQLVDFGKVEPCLHSLTPGQCSPLRHAAMQSVLLCGGKAGVVFRQCQPPAFMRLAQAIPTRCKRFQ